MSLGFCLNSKVSLRLGFLSIITNYKIADCVLNPVNYDFAATFYDFASKFPLLIFNDFAAFFTISRLIFINFAAKKTWSLETELSEKNNHVSKSFSGHLEHF